MDKIYKFIYGEEKYYQLLELGFIVLEPKQFILQILKKVLNYLQKKGGSYVC